MNTASKKDNDANSLFTDELAITVLNSLSAHIAILDENGVILETNRAWRDFSAKSGLQKDHDDREAIIWQSVRRPPAAMPGTRVKLPKEFGRLLVVKWKNFYTIIPAILRTALTGTICGPYACPAPAPCGW